MPSGAGSSPAPDVLRFPDLDIAALAQRRSGRDRQLRLWYALHAFTTFPGHALPEDVDRAAQFLHLSKRALSAILKAGAGVMWRLHRGHVYPLSVGHVAAALGVGWLRQPYRAPLSDLVENLAMLRARMATEAIAHLRTLRVRGRVVYAPISNAAMARMLNASVRTVQVWKNADALLARMLGVPVRTVKIAHPTLARELSWIYQRENFALVCRLRKGERARDFFEIGGPSLRCVRWGRRRWLARQMASSLIPGSHTRPGGRSAVRRANRQLRKIAPCRAPFSSSGEGSARLNRCVYHVRPRRGAPTSSGSQYRLVGEETRRRPRATLWEPVECPGTFRDITPLPLPLPNPQNISPPFLSCVPGGLRLWGSAPRHWGAPRTALAAHAAGGGPEEWDEVLRAGAQMSAWRTRGLAGRRRGSITHEPVREGKAVRCRYGFSIRGSERFIADQVAAFGSVCPIVQRDVEVEP